MALQINTTNYSKLNANITDIMRTGGFSGVSMNIYTDDNATSLALDGTAPIENRRVNTVNTTGAYTIATSGEYVNAAVTIIFSDGSSIKVVDTVDEYWCTIEGITFVRRTF